MPLPTNLSHNSRSPLSPSFTSSTSRTPPRRSKSSGPFSFTSTAGVSSSSGPPRPPVGSSTEIKFYGAGPLQRRASASIVTGSKDGNLNLGYPSPKGSMCQQCVRLRAENGDVKDRLKEEAGRSAFYRQEMERSRGERDEARAEVAELQKLNDSRIKRLRDAEDIIRRLEREVKEAERRGKEEVLREREKAEDDRVGRGRAEGELSVCKAELAMLEDKIGSLRSQLVGLEVEKEKLSRERDEAVEELLRIVNERKESKDLEDGRDERERRMREQIGLIKKEWERMKDENLKLLRTIKLGKKETASKGTITDESAADSTDTCVGTSPIKIRSMGVGTEKAKDAPTPTSSSIAASTQTETKDDAILRRSVKLLRESVETELSCVKKHNHLLNLSNTGNLRSLQVKVSGLELRLSAANRIKDVLEFHAVSAERKLGEYEFDTSTKIKQGREGRERLERERLARELEGLEQRSKEAGGIMGEIMMERVPEARVKAEEAKKLRERVVKDIVEGFGEHWGGDRVEFTANGDVRSVYLK